MSRKKNYTTVPRNGLVAEYLLDGNANATVGTNGTATNVTWGTDGTIGYQKGYGIFNGTNAYISNLYQVGHGTIYAFFAWVKYGNGLSITGGGSGQYYTFTLGQNATGLYYGQAGLGGTGGTYEITQSTKFINDGKWHLVSFIRNGANKYLYLDNEIIASTIGGTTQAITTGKSISLCGRYNGSSWVDLANQNILLARWYSNYIPSQEEITNLYQEGLRKLGPTNAILSGNFPLYSLPNLEYGKILEISKPKVGSNYINQVDGSSYVATNVTDSTNGKYNKMSFNGTSSDINCGTSVGNFNNQDFSVGAWIYNNDTTNEKAIIARYDYDNNKREWYLGKAPNNRYFFRVGTGVYADILEPTSPTMPTGKWVRVIGTYTNSNKTLRLYVNGIKIGELVGIYGVTAHTQTTGIGRLFDTPVTGFWNGDIALPIIQNRALSDIEIQQDYYAHKIV